MAQSCLLGQKRSAAFYCIDLLRVRMTSLSSLSHNSSNLFDRLQPFGHYQRLSEDISVRTMLLSHGRYPTSPAVYESAAFFVRHNTSHKEFLFFGDVEPDSVAGSGRNQAIWDVAAKMIPHRLSTIFIECSWPLGRSDNTLFGHLNPEHLVEELVNLAMTVWEMRNAAAAAEAQAAAANGESSSDFVVCEPDRYENGVSPTEDYGHNHNGNGGDRPSPSSTSSDLAHQHIRKKQKVKHAVTPPPLPMDEPGPDDIAGMLDGVRVVIIHCKDDLRGEYDRPVNLVIADQVRELVQQRALGAEIVAAVQGMHLCELTVAPTGGLCSVLSVY